MKNTFGSSVSVTLFGESHGEYIGAVIDGLAPGIEIDREYIARMLTLRRPSGRISTPRKENDEYKIVSGVLENVTIFDYLEQAFYRSINMVKMVFDSLGGIISGRFGMESVSGPVGIVETVEQVTKVSAAALVNLVVMISMNLGIFNLLPIPALDGGRIVFHLIDGIAGRKVIKKEIEDTITAITMMLLLGFMLLISIKDVINLF